MMQSLTGNPVENSDVIYSLRITKKDNTLLIPKYLIKERQLNEGDIVLFIKSESDFKIKVHRNN
jgi:hypothetical protein